MPLSMDDVEESNKQTVYPAFIAAYLETHY
jgi:hypothetical protein